MLQHWRLPEDFRMPQAKRSPAPTDWKGPGTSLASGQQRAAPNAWFEQLAALVHHDGSREALELIANLYTSVFVLDDMLDDERALIGGTVELAEHVAAYLSAAVAAEPRPRLRAGVPSYEVIEGSVNVFMGRARGVVS
jgi:hypothetical protein